MSERIVIAVPGNLANLRVRQTEREREMSPLGAGQTSWIGVLLIPYQFNSLIVSDTVSTRQAFRNFVGRGSRPSLPVETKLRSLFPAGINYPKLSKLVTDTESVKLADISRDEVVRDELDQYIENVWSEMSGPFSRRDGAVSNEWSTLIVSHPIVSQALLLFLLDRLRTVPESVSSNIKNITLGEADAIVAEIADDGAVKITHLKGSPLQLKINYLLNGLG